MQIGRGKEVCSTWEHTGLKGTLELRKRWLDESQKTGTRGAIGSSAGLQEESTCSHYLWLLTWQTMFKWLCYTGGNIRRLFVLFNATVIKGIKITTLAFYVEQPFPCCFIYKPVIMNKRWGFPFKVLSVTLEF